MKQVSHTHYLSVAAYGKVGCAGPVLRAGVGGSEALWSGIGATEPQARAPMAIKARQSAAQPPCLCIFSCS